MNPGADHRTFNCQRDIFEPTPITTHCDLFFWQLVYKAPKGPPDNSPRRKPWETGGAPPFFFIQPA